jgi:hypothetical protein
MSPELAVGSGGIFVIGLMEEETDLSQTIPK